MPKQCFVIGPIGEAGSQTRAAADAFMKYIVEPTLASFDYSAPVLRADTLGEPGRITSQIIKLLMDADLVIADLTANNPNVFYELSLRHALGKPAIHMAADGTILPFDLHDNRTIFYTMDIRDVNAACAELARQIGVVRAAGYKANNPITETLGAIELSTSHDPIRQAANSALTTYRAQLVYRHYTAADLTAVVAAVAQLVTDAASPTQAHVTTANSALTTFNTGLI